MLQKDTADNDIEGIAFLARGLSDANRIRILLAIADGKKSVSRIVEEVGLSQPLVSHHLKELKRSLLVKVERKGPFVYYAASDGAVFGILDNLLKLMKKLSSEE